jgi:hypothetical protein
MIVHLGTIDFALQTARSYKCLSYSLSDLASSARRNEICADIASYCFNKNGFPDIKLKNQGLIIKLDMHTRRD